MESVVDFIQDVVSFTPINKLLTLLIVIEFSGHLMLCFFPRDLQIHTIS